MEITQPGLQQVQMIPKIDFTFATAMRAFLRADPDVILIDEIDSSEPMILGTEATNAFSDSAGSCANSTG